jgi:hypothetical protein
MGKKSGSGIRDKHVGSATLRLGIVLIRKIRFFSTETFFLQIFGHKYLGLGPDSGLSKKSGSRSVFSVHGTATETLGEMLGKTLANLCF